METALDKFESDGLFWLPGRDDNQVAGRISFDPAKGTKLSLIGTFSNSELGVDTGDEMQVSTIHGVAGKRFITLTECSRTGFRVESPGFPREDYRSDATFAGHALLRPDGQGFTEAIIRFSNLYDWVGKSAVSRELSYDNETRAITQAVLTLTPPRTEEHPADGCKVSLSPSWKVLGGAQKPGFEQDYSLRIIYDNPVDFAIVRGDISILQDLISATTDSASVPSQITLRIPIEEDDEKSKPQPIVHLYEQPSADPASLQRKARRILVGLSDIGGLPAVANWLNFMRSHKIVLGLALSPIYRGMYVENKFFNTVSAAETLHRMEFPNEIRPAAEYKAFKKMLVRHVPKNYQSWLSQQLSFSNEPRLRDRLKELAEFGSLAGILDCDVQQWAKAVTKTRNRMVHHDKGQGPGASSTELYWLAESLRLTVLLCLMRFCTFRDYQNRIKEHPSVKLIGRRVRPILQADETVH
ncbi:HEPN domain-containing protein [Streptomyces sp. 4N509B]|uniref:ApeA N-terminal domain 1-containing protein n=1 Tax=Streptomyces sp. 4N509B TaxID=3457413 RepID=UPI003FD17118